METNNAENIENSTKNTVVNKQNEEINLLSLSVVRRDGSITPFKSDKIANAIRKAFLAQTDIRDNGKIDQTINDITETVTGALTRRIANGDMIHIEDIQDQVELALMRGEHHKVARAYVLYREQRAKQRYKTAKLNEQVGAKVSTMAVTKRDGNKEDISLEKITNLQKSALYRILSTTSLNRILSVESTLEGNPIGLYSLINTLQRDLISKKSNPDLYERNLQKNYVIRIIELSKDQKLNPEIQGYLYKKIGEMERYFKNLKKNNDDLLKTHYSYCHNLIKEIDHL